eukprot:g5429.t1
MHSHVPDRATSSGARSFGFVAPENRWELRTGAARCDRLRHVATGALLSRSADFRCWADPHAHSAAQQVTATAACHAAATSGGGDTMASGRADAIRPARLPAKPVTDGVEAEAGFALQVVPGVRVGSGTAAAAAAAAAAGGCGGALLPPPRPTAPRFASSASLLRNDPRFLLAQPGTHARVGPGTYGRSRGIAAQAEAGRSTGTSSFNSSRRASPFEPQPCLRQAEVRPLPVATDDAQKLERSLLRVEAAARKQQRRRLWGGRLAEAALRVRQVQPLPFGFDAIKMAPDSSSITPHGKAVIRALTTHNSV